MENEIKVFMGKYKYKYMPYGEGAKALIEHSTMKFSHPDEFNDPFDCLPSYSQESIQNIVQGAPHLIQQVLNEHESSSSHEIKNKQDLIERFKNSVESGQYIKSIKNGLGICSLTSKACNLLMWAHYGDKHTGIVAEFHNDLPQDDYLDSKYLIAFHTEYKNDKPVQDIYKSDLLYDILTKGKEWDYEDEIRVIDYNRKSGIHPYERKLLSSIILGIKFNKKLKSEIKELINKVNEEHGMNIKLYQAEIVPNKFKIYIPEHPVYGSPNWSDE